MREKQVLIPMSQFSDDDLLCSETELDISEDEAELEFEIILSTNATEDYSELLDSILTDLIMRELFDIVNS